MDNKERLFSLDLLRGLDMFLLTVVGPLFWAIHRLADFPGAVTAQFRHPWGGFTLWDLIMPLFIFMCGAAVPFALGRRMENGRPTGDYWGHVALRVVLLWFCGLLVQGDLASLNLDRIYPYSNTLQSIAAGYLVAALVFAVPVRAVRALAPVVLMAVYGGLLHFLGDYTTTGNFAFLVEKKVLAALLPASSELAKGIAALTDSVAPGTSKFHYTWWLTTLMFGAMTLCGAQCAEILRGDGKPRQKALALGLLGAVLLGVGSALTPWIPPIKHIFTVSFTCEAMGLSALLLAGLYWLTDVRKFRAGMWVFTLFGQCALTAYMASHFFHRALRGAAETVVQGVPHLLGADAAGLPPEQVQHFKDVQGVWIAVASAVLLTAVLWIRRRMRGAAAHAEAPHEDQPGAVAPGRDNGAVAARYRLPDADTAKKPAFPAPAREEESAGPKMATKVHLQLHKKPEAPASQPEPPLQQNPSLIRLKPPTGAVPRPTADPERPGL